MPLTSSAKLHRKWLNGRGRSYKVADGPSIGTRQLDEFTRFESPFPFFNRDNSSPRSINHFGCIGLRHANPLARLLQKITQFSGINTV